MTIYEIMTSCLFLLDNDGMVASLDSLKPYYENYKNGIGYNTVDSNIIVSTDEVMNYTPEEFRKLEYQNKVRSVENTNKVLRMLKFLCNKVLKLISTNYLKPYRIQGITISNGEFDLSNLQNFMSVKNVRSSSKDFCEYEIVQNKLRIENGNYEITYNYKIDNYDYFDDIEDFSCNLTYMPVVDGVLGEYYILNGFYDEADFYLTRFESQMVALNAKTNERRLKERVWL